MCDDEIIIPDNEEKIKAEKEKNPIWQKFQEVKNSINDIDCLINILLTAIDNDFNTPENYEVMKFLHIIQDHIEKHDKLLDEFVNKLNLPDGKAKLISIQYNKLKD